MCDLLSVPDPRIIMVALEGLENILKIEPESDSYASEIDNNGGVEKIEKLQEHNMPEIANKATNIIEKHFGGTDEDFEIQSNNAAPINPQNPFGFAPPPQGFHF